MCVLGQESSAAKRAREREEAKKQKEAARASESLVRFAETSRLKIEQLVVQLQAVVAHSQFQAVPSVVADPITAALEDCGGRAMTTTGSFALQCS